MLRLEQITKGCALKGIVPGATVNVVDAEWIGDVVSLTYRTQDGKVATELKFRSDEPGLELAGRGTSWAFDSAGALFRLLSEAKRIQLAYLFDPLLAVHSSQIEPLPHQILAVYQEMLSPSRQPLRFLLADDPGAGKTIMAGLLVRELMLRGDLRRCMVVCPGALAEQWQDELHEKFDLDFSIATRDSMEAAATGNWFQEHDLAICRLDKLSRDEAAREKLKASDWDLIICDEAHKMSASYPGGEFKSTKRYQLGKLLGERTRNFLLMTATPHNGKNEDFQAFLALLDADRFEGRQRSGTKAVDASDLMRRMMKEQLRHFDGSHIFPERTATTIGYDLSPLEDRLYTEVSDYVRNEFNRADKLGDNARKGTVGFALTVLQRRLASSPEAIYRSLKRRRERLEDRLREAELRRSDGHISNDVGPSYSSLSEEELAEKLTDIDDATGTDYEKEEEALLDQATTAQTIAELRAETQILAGLESLAQQVRDGQTDRKWEELRNLLNENPALLHPNGHRRKLVIFTEHRDTLEYLAKRLRTLIGRDEAIVEIHGSMRREERRRAQEKFTTEEQTEILLATDAAGEGINLQRAHLMVNYDLPWNPNRLEQRFGRIHRIGQREVCHLWNLVAEKTREGAVYQRLLEKLEEARKALHGGVFDVLGQLFRERPLRDLLIEAVRYGDSQEVRDRLLQKIDNLADRERCRDLIEERALIHATLDTSEIQRVREDWERALARRLQPHFIQTFFLAAFQHLGGSAFEREPRRFQIKYVPPLLRHRELPIKTGRPVLTNYERVTFERNLRHVDGRPPAEYITPGHPLLAATIDLITERHQGLLRRGAALVDKATTTEDLRVLFYLDHSIVDGTKDRDGNRRVISRRLQFVEVDANGNVRNGGYAPYLDYRPVREEEKPLVEGLIGAANWLQAEEIEKNALAYAVQHLVPEHFEEVSTQRLRAVERTRAAVHDRLTREISYWDRRAQQLKDQELAGRPNARLNSGNARARAEELEGRLLARMAELEKERQLSKLPPNIVGGALIIPECLLDRLLGQHGSSLLDQHRNLEIERMAMAAVMARERELGFEPRDVSRERVGYDIESRHGDGRLRFIEVKGRRAGAETVTVTRNEILTALNKPDEFILAIVQCDGDQTSSAYIRRPFRNDPDFAVESVNYNLSELLQKAEVPA
ncbi:MAG: helicase-related protein [Acidobacteriaceae bacterium]